MSVSSESRKYFFLAVNTGFARDGLPDQRCFDFYRDRSGHGLYCSIVGNVVIPNGVGSNEVCSVMSNSDAWHRLAMVISEQGALPGIQLSTTWHGYNGIKKFISRSNENKFEEYRQIASHLSRLEVQKEIDALRLGTELAIKAGFRHVQLHAAHGYLFNLMIDHRLSKHSGLMKDLIKAWAEDLTSAGIQSSIRFSIFSGLSIVDDFEQDKFLQNITDLPVSFFDVSAGFYNIDKHLIYPSSSEHLSARRNATLELAAKYPDKQFILSGRSKAISSDSLLQNIHIGLCRDLIANPNFLQNSSFGCKNSMKCHYFSRGKDHITCEYWSGLTK